MPNCKRGGAGSRPHSPNVPLVHPDVFGLSISIVYQDDALVIVHKPAGMLVHRSPGARDPVVVMTFVRDVLGCHAWPVHRLDRATSGLVLVAITLQAAQRMYALFQKSAIRKTYLAAVAGVAPRQDRLQAPLEKRPGQIQAAATEYERISTSAGCSLLRVEPLSGRRHQIRRHLQGAALPILGDPLYGDPERNREAAAHGLTRLALHASRLRFPHPLTGAPVDVEAPPPDGLTAPLIRMGLFPVIPPDP